jgi:hypothetical protein
VPAAAILIEGHEVWWVDNQPVLAAAASSKGRVPGRRDWRCAADWRCVAAGGMSSRVEAVLSPRQPAFGHRQSDTSDAGVTVGMEMSRSAGNRRAAAGDAGAAPARLAAWCIRRAPPPRAIGTEAVGAGNGPGRPTGSYLCVAIPSIRHNRLDHPAATMSCRFAERAVVNSVAVAAW